MDVRHIEGRPGEKGKPGCVIMCLRSPEYGKLFKDYIVPDKYRHPTTVRSAGFLPEQYHDLTDDAMISAPAFAKKPFMMNPKYQELFSSSKPIGGSAEEEHHGLTDGAVISESESFVDSKQKQVLAAIAGADAHWTNGHSHVRRPRSGTGSSQGAAPMAPSAYQPSSGAEEEGEVLASVAPVASQSPLRAAPHIVKQVKFAADTTRIVRKWLIFRIFSQWINDDAANITSHIPTQRRQRKPPLPRRKNYKGCYKLPPLFVFIIAKRSNIHIVYWLYIIFLKFMAMENLSQPVFER